MDLEALERVLSAWPTSLRTDGPGVCVLEQFQTIISKVIDDETKRHGSNQPGGQSEHRRMINSASLVIGAAGQGMELTQALGLVEEEVEDTADGPAQVQQMPMFASMGKRKIPQEVTLDELRRAPAYVGAWGAEMQPCD